MSHSEELVNDCCDHQLSMLFRPDSDYYTLECLLYFLKNIKQSHAEYVRGAKGEVPIVRRYSQCR